MFSREKIFCPCAFVNKGSELYSDITVCSPLKSMDILHGGKKKGYLKPR